MNRFRVFTGRHYYPCGGMEDFKGSYPTREAAQASLSDEDEWAQIYDVQTGVMTRLGRADGHGWSGPWEELYTATPGEEGTAK